MLTDENIVYQQHFIQYTSSNKTCSEKSCLFIKKQNKDALTVGNKIDG